MSTQLLVIGLAGSGKSTVGKAVALKLGMPYVDGDSLHPNSNLEKMAKGTPLSDDDRDQWIANILHALEFGNIVVGASLLKHHYRALIRKNVPNIRFAQLDAPLSILKVRLEAATGVIDRTNLIDSQLAIFEPLDEREPGKIYDATKPVEELVSEILRDLRAD